MEDKVVALKTYENIANANLDSEILKRNGIEALVGEEQVVELFPMFKDIDEGLKVYVFEKDYRKALELLKDYHSADVK
ncbi:hypothetical protein D0T49_00740 [Paludibacter sp. 221]|uniref:hypothetical protein n=1 Tax=Paludibacter sp. 221 TaxID=2302939 RepID=UPI0013D4D32C|nr:hypothetical protein [Paludibacter sp. 221]NDV45580.1 hypothetical protein [Paludibacter sp. 221]